eukprot:1155493-Pelagomonas_calceolata.AAC.4
MFQCYKRRGHLQAGHEHDRHIIVRVSTRLHLDTHRQRLAREEGQEGLAQLLVVWSVQEGDVARPQHVLGAGMQRHEKRVLCISMSDEHKRERPIGTCHSVKASTCLYASGSSGGAAVPKGLE